MIDRILDAVAALIDAAIAPVVLFGGLLLLPIAANAIAAFAL